MLLWLDEITSGHRELVGGKAAALAEMVRAGFRVPLGFCVTTEACREFIETNGLAERLEKLAGGHTKAADDARALFARGRLNDVLVREITAAHHKLLSRCPAVDHVAVRSSATVEDMPRASFAGQGDTYLNVEGQDLVERVRDCWASLWSPRAVSYRRQLGSTTSAPQMAAVVQAMIPCDLGGVAFGEDPLGRHVVLIEAVRGLAEGVVAGTGAITRYVIDKQSFEWHREGEAQDILSPSQIRLLTETVLALHKHFREPRDAEWGFWKGELYLFQSRPITARGHRFFTHSIPGDNYLWTAGYLNERFPEPVSPLGWSVVGALTEERAFRDPLRYMGYPGLDRLPLTKLYRGHPYSNVRVFQMFYKVFPEALLPDDASRYFPGGNTDLRRKAPYPCCVADPRFLASMLYHFVRDPLNWSPLHNYKRWARFALRQEEAMDELACKLENAAHAATLWEIIDAARRWSNELLALHRWSLMAADLTVTALRRLLQRWVDRELAGSLLARLLSGLPNKSVEADDALEKLRAQKLPDKAAFEAFLAKYGHRSFSLDIYRPTFADDPGQILTLLKLPASGLDRKALVRARGRAEREVKALITINAFGRLRVAVFDRLLRLARRYVILRENQRFAWQRSLALMRHALVRMGGMLVERGWLSKPEDVFFATLGELGGLTDFLRSKPGRPAARAQGLEPAELRADLDARKAAYRQLENETQLAPHIAYPAFVHGNEPLEEARIEGGRRWRGVPVSPGLVRAAVRVVRSPDELGRISAGDVLVTHATDPGWTAVFGRLGGLIMERGGQLSHGSVMAREYSLPTVVGIPNITQQLEDGNVVLLDGQTGTVEVVQS